MSTPAWIPAKNVTITVNGTPMSATSGEYSEDLGDVDVTNLNSGGFYESIGDITHATLRMTIVCDANALVSLPARNAIVAASFVATSGYSHSGNFRIARRSEKGGPKGAYEVTLEGPFTGSVT